ncbi:MAG: tRNA (adenosine(37)-N6)-dimethylallyltransferase MiaA [Desulfobacterales bacterium]|jgi:tRNA dimethylallyltransferase|nr:tRNA (adenosine(37)-N6)-dimethylallyltransferase MiaA [Desulfobacteraceae bacterium]MBT7085378.1 tRNA (adenosine(37)-N6)-dimethylallyltransferase MiaA [Desulfobacterales bacterium]MBT7697080.1 tRNA (adenosine(37)-N6)-dimethylallyltransferase MiaA [Desulfobacterales bacterium]
MSNETNKPSVIVICGPTGIGKTSSSIRLAKIFGGEIISADSMQIYRHMNIGTAKPAKEEQALITHHMIDIVDPDEPFDAARFGEMAEYRITELHNKKIIPFLVGGTGLYIKALLHGLSRARPANPQILERLEKEAENVGPEVLHKRLLACDPIAAEKIHPNDVFRLVRALEIFEETGKPISEYHNEHMFKKTPYKTLKICLDMERDKLYNRIDLRVDLMLKTGLIEEVQGLLDAGYTTDLKPMQSIGYRHIVDYLSGNTPLNETVETLKRDTRRYAKRQMTWFRADNDIKWINRDNFDEMQELISKFFHKHL